MTSQKDQALLQLGEAQEQVQQHSTSLANLEMVLEQFTQGTRGWRDTFSPSGPCARCGHLKAEDYPENLTFEEIFGMGICISW